MTKNFGMRTKQKLRNVEQAVKSARIYSIFRAFSKSGLGRFSLNASRGQLLAEARKGGNRRAMAIVNHLRRLRNFKSAAAAAELVDTRELEPRNYLAVVQTLFAGMEGVRGDTLLDSFFSRYCLEKLVAGDQKILADVIARSGAPRELKRERLAALEAVARSENVRRDVRYREFVLKLSMDTDFDVVGYAELNKIDFDRPTEQLQYVPHLKVLGFEQEARELLAVLYQRYGVTHPGVLYALLSFDPRWPGVSITNLPIGFYSKPESLQFLSDNKGAGEDFKQAFERCRKAVIGSYAAADIYRKERILDRLLRLDMLDEVEALSLSGDHLPNTVLPPQVAAGLRALVNDDYLSAKDRFLNVLQENPADSTAAAGLRLALPRAGGDMGSIVSIRNTIGYGAKGAGRRGHRGDLGPEHTTSLLMQGKYCEGLYAKRHLEHWQLLERVYDTRFYNFRRLPQSGGKIFVIGDEGVGDEVRTAQFYYHLAQRFDQVTISCDPRLKDLFSQSFPNIEFIASERYHKGVEKHIKTGKERVNGLNLKLSQILTEDCRQAMDKSDIITFGQNLFFNRFVGNVPRSDDGAYLLPSAVKRPIGEKLKIGLLWRSHLMSMRRKFIYLKVEDFAPLLELDGVELVSVQHMMSNEEREYCVANGIKLIEDVDLYNDFDGMAPRLQELDLVVGISSFPIELAAALGTPVWMLGFSPENYFLRTAGGKTEVDQLTMNSTVVAPKWIDFSAPAQECISVVMQDVCHRIEFMRRLPLAV